MITPEDFNFYEIMNDSTFWSLRHVLEESKKHVIPPAKKGKANAEFQVGYYDGIIILGHNTGSKGGYNPVEYVDDIEKKIKECVSKNGLFQGTDIKQVIIAKPSNNIDTYHAEMNIIKTVFQKINDSTPGKYKIDGELFIAGDKFPCVKCMKKIYSLNRENAEKGIKILIPDFNMEYNNQRVFTQYDKDPVNWCDPF